MKKNKRILNRGMILALFILYLAALGYLVFFAERYGRAPGSRSVLRYNLKPFAEIRRFLNNRDLLGTGNVFLNVEGNVLAFLPLGVFLPLLAGAMQKYRRMLVAGFMISLLVETIQLITGVGSFDVDDIILNTGGTLLGYCLYWIFERMRRKHYG